MAFDRHSVEAQDSGAHVETLISFVVTHLWCDVVTGGSVHGKETGGSVDTGGTVKIDPRQ